MAIENELDKLESRIPQIEVTVPKVSARSVGWHILHSLKVADSILTALEKSKPERYKRKFNFYRAVFLRLNMFPRGRAKAPRIVQPEPDDISEEEIRLLFIKVRSRLSSLDHHHPNAYFKHPYFGKMNIAHTRKFLGIHTRHHLKIIRDIVGL